MAELSGQTAFITGAGSGLGREIALSFAHAGARVAVNGLRTDAAAEVARALGSSLLRAARRDVSDSHVVRGWFETLAAASGNRLDVLAGRPARRSARDRRDGAVPRGPGASYFTGQVLSPNGGLVI
jgi:NAD(P)-dependent dehydrogenase (short-subunit alcohol dehydrogenase family)